MKAIVKSFALRTPGLTGTKIVVGLSALLVGLFASSTASLAKPKKPAPSATCKCECYWKDSEGEVHWGKNTYTVNSAGGCDSINDKVGWSCDGEHQGRLDYCEEQSKPSAARAPGVGPATDEPVAPPAKAPQRVPTTGIQQK